MVSRYQQRISGPLMDRIDIHLELARVPFQKLADLENGEASPLIRERVEAARKRQAKRFDALDKPNILVNSDMGPSEVQLYCQIDEDGRISFSKYPNNVACDMLLIYETRDLFILVCWCSKVGSIFLMVLLLALHAAPISLLLHFAKYIN